MFSESVFNKSKPSELAVVSRGEPSYCNGGLWQAVMWFSAAIATGLILGALFFNFAEASEEPSGKRYFQIEPKNISMALNEFAMQADSEILFTPDIVEGKQTGGLTGQFTDSEALTKILAGSGLEYKQVDEKVFLVVDPDTFEGNADLYKSKNENNTDKRVIEEITVTATKRETSLHDISMSITALSSEEIKRRGLVGMGDYLNSVPGVSVVDQSAGRTAVVMRGLAANAQLDGRTTGPTVGVYFGEVSVSGLSQSGMHPDIKLVDMERVEVLRGPQGTLYGASSLSGTVRNIPKSPNLEEFEGEFKAGYSNTGKLGGNNTDFQAVINIPFVEGQFGIRAVGYRYENSGYYKNIGPNDSNVAAGIATYGAASVARNDIGNDEYLGGRVSALWRPVQELTINLTYLHQDIDQDGWPSSDLTLGGGNYLQRRYQTSAQGITEPKFDEGYGHELDLVNMTIEYDFGKASLLSSTSSTTAKPFGRRDIGLMFFGNIPLSQESNFESKLFSQEVRIATNLEGPFQVIAGLYVEELQQDEFTWNGFGGADLVSNPFGQHDVAIGGFKRNVEQQAVFGEFSYQFNDVLKLTVGGRAFSYDRTDVDITQAAAFSVDSTTLLESESSDNSYKVGLDYTPNEDSLLYAVWSQGFRLGSPKAPTLIPACDTDNDGIFDGSNGVSTGAGQLDSDYVDSYEVGGKFTFLNDQLQINADVYELKWDGIPVLVVFSGACGTFLNAGKARTRGAEFEGSYVVANSLILNFGGSYTDAELTENAPSIGFAGDRLPGSPKYNFNAGLQYEFLIADHNVYVRSDYYYVGGFFNNLQEAGQEVGDYGQLNVRGGVNIGDVKFEVFANNITNENAYTWIEVDGGNQVAHQLRPRTVGISLSYTF